MKRRIFRWAGFIIVLLSVPAIGWNLAEAPEIEGVMPVVKTELTKPELIVASNVNEELSASAAFDRHISYIYEKAKLQEASLNYDVFKKALTGYYNFRSSNLVSDKKEIITIVDFTKPSTERRLWIVDLADNKILYNTYVAHGRGSGGNIATSFSNTPNSHQSSLGFYITSNTYHGKHGLSLKLNGMDENYNTNALDRAVVIHGADYVSEKFIKTHGRLGRSHGCPALPVELTSEIVKTIKGKTAMFINGPDEKYNSSFLDESLALNQFSQKTDEAVL